MNMPEEYGYVDDFLSFSYLCPNIQSRLRYEGWCAKSEVVSFNLTDLLHNDTKDTFSKLVHTYLSKNAISA